MAQRMDYVCDGCGAVKREGNHWFLFTEDRGSACIIRWTPEAVSTYKSARHLCGESCAIFAVSNFCAKQPVEQCG